MTIWRAGRTVMHWFAKPACFDTNGFDSRALRQFPPVAELANAAASKAAVERQCRFESYRADQRRVLLNGRQSVPKTEAPEKVGVRFVYPPPINLPAKREENEERQP